MDTYVKWFEDICTCLSRDPQAATAAIVRFRDLDDAHQLCMHFISASHRSDVKFHALHILKYTLVKRWLHFTASHVSALQAFLWKVLTDDATLEPYALNKLIQVYSFILKRSWTTDSDEARQTHFRIIEHFCSGVDGTPIRRLHVASKTLRAIVDDMSSTEELGAGLTHVECTRIRKEFVLGRDLLDNSVSGLMLTANLTIAILNMVHNLTSPFDAFVHALSSENSEGSDPLVTISDIQLLDLTLAVGEISEVAVSVLRLCESSASTAMDSFNTGCTNIAEKGFSSVYDSGPDVSNSKHKHSFSWLPHFLSKDTVSILFQLHHRMRSVLIAFHFRPSLISVVASSMIQAPSLKASCGSLSACLGSVAGMLLAFASIDIAAIFPSRHKRVCYAEILLSEAIAYIQANVSSLAAIGGGSGELFGLLLHMHDDGEYAVQEFTHGADLIMRIVGNFKLSLLTSLPSFEKVINAFSEISNTTSSMLLLLTDSNDRGNDPAVTYLRTRYKHLSEVSESFLGGPLMEVLTSCLDGWGLIIGDPMLCGPTPSIVEEEMAAAARVRCGLQEICGPMFHQMYRCTISVIIQDTLKSENEELDVENDGIFETSVLNLVRGVSDVGRMSVFSALCNVSACIQQSTTRLDAVFEQLAVNSVVDEKALRMEVISQLEIQRLSAEFLSCLLVQSESDYRKEGTLGDIVSCSEPPLIPSSVLDCCSGSAEMPDRLETHIMASVELILQNLKQQCRFHQEASDIARLTKCSGSQKKFYESAISPLVVQGLLKFLKLFIWAYVDPGHDLYETHPEVLCPQLMDAMHSGGTFNHTFLDPVLQMSFYSFARLGRGNDDIGRVAIGVLRCVSKLRRLPVLGGLTGLQQLMGFARTNICPSNRSSHEREGVHLPDYSLSVVNLTSLWQHLGYIAHELTAGVTADVAELGKMYLSELCSILSSSFEYCSHSLQQQLIGSKTVSSSPVNNFLYLVASFRGLSKCTTSLSPDVLAYFERTLPLMYGGVVETVSQSVKNGHSVLSSKLVCEWLGFLADFAETTPLSSLPQSTMHAVLLIARDTLLATVFNNLKQLRPAYQASVGRGTNNGVENTELSSLFIEILGWTLTYLDHIASSDVSVSIRCGDGTSGGAMVATGRHTGIHARASREQNVEVDGLLCIALLMLSSEIVDVGIMSSFKFIQEKYLSIVNLILRSHPLALGLQWVTLGGGFDSPGASDAKLAVLANLLTQIISAIDSHDCSTGRLALLALKSCGVFYKKISSPSFNLPMENREICSAAINRSADSFLRLSISHLLNMMLPGPVPPSDAGGDTSDGAIVSSSVLLRLRDRTDTFASTLLELVQIDSGQRLHALVSQFLSSRGRPEPANLSYSDATLQVQQIFEKLFTGRGVNLQVVTKQNERNFISNMRECLVDLQLLAHSV